MALSALHITATQRERASAKGVDPAWQRLWFSTLQKAWSSLAIVPTDPGLPVSQLAEVIVAVGRQHGEKSVRFLDATGVHVNDVQRIVAAIKLASDADAMIVVVDPIAQNPAALHIVRSTSGVLLVARIGDSRLASARSTVNAVGRDRMLGSVALV